MRQIIPGCLLVLFVFLVYLPAMHGAFVWDDDSWTTNLLPFFHDFSGLGVIWIHPTAMQQYYPLTGTSFWLDYQFWHLWTTPYHVENVLLHAASAVLFWRLLVQLRLPGAWLAGAIFAIHPIMVESVAWITERKNVLSLAPYLGALLAYGKYAHWETITEEATPTSGKPRGKSRREFYYGIAFVLFLCALLAKTTAFSLPAVILLIGWWKRGQIRWRADMMPTLPFFAAGICLSTITGWLEKHHLGAQGADFALTFPQRCLATGHSFWSYLGNLFWPTRLCFVYPHWQPNPGLWWQWLFPATALAALLALWLARGRIGRGPATAMFFFVGTLFPVLGFMNAYGMAYSLIWDHWVYVSAPGIIALVGALVARAAESLRAPAVAYGFAAIVLPILALLTWRQAGMYTDEETLWRRTLAENPGSWLAHNDLGLLLMRQGHVDEAMEHYQDAIQFDTNAFQAFNNLGMAFAARGQVDDAIVNYRNAVKLNPKFSEAYYNLGVALMARGQSDEAIEAYRQAIQNKPAFVQALNNLGSALAARGEFGEAIDNYRKALAIDPNSPIVMNHLAWALAVSPDDRLRNGAEAVRWAERACEMTQYGQPVFLTTLAAAYAEAGRFNEAIACAQKARTVALEQGQGDVAAPDEKMLELFKAGRAYHETARTGQ
ncbi:MAG TPA: tetratricopeptide repeat protein [Verrucomicrobiae bacterium]|nr:tetratricopeptide repeat protein [Verrucomicrobiae bacterium]